ncbi:MAG: hypothetical protein ACLPUG_13750 [Acidimicrobiales bacterium]|jgi:hypothetical protein
MKKLIITVAAGLMAIGGVVAGAVVGAGAGAATGHAGAATTTTTTTLAPPVQGVGPHKVFFSVDTVQGGGGTVKLPADAACSMTNLFQRGDVVVFRMYGVHVSTGGNDLTNVTVKNAFVNVPGLPAIPLVYSTHPTKPAMSYWTAAWPVGKTYPLGVVNYSVTVITNPVPAGLTAGVPSEKGVFMQQDSPQVASMLTIEPSS